MRVHVVSPGECLTQIAHRNGFHSYDKIWNHPDNTQLKKLRKHPDILHPGDRVTIPDPDQEVRARAADQTHVFRLRTPRRRLKVVLQDADGNPLGGVAYRLEVGDSIFERTASRDGVIEHDVPLTVNEGTLTLNRQSFPIRIGHLNPLVNVDDDGLSGARSRLRNLGLAMGELSEEEIGLAVRSFRKSHGLDPDGGFDEDLASKLEAEHGC